MRTSVATGSGRGFRRLTLAVIATLFATLSLQAVAAAQVCDGGYVGNSQGVLPERTRERFAWLVRPDFARLRLARMPPSGSDAPAEGHDATLKAGGGMTVQLVIKNTSTEVKSIILAGTYKLDRPSLHRDGELMPYRKKVVEQVRASDNPGTEYSRHERIGPGDERTELIDLDDWYEPLRPGRYTLKVCHRFIWGGQWLESPPLTFEVIP